MAAGKLSWDNDGERFYETGIKKGVVYPYDTATKTYTNGVAWNGLSSVSESPSGGEANNIYADDIKYLSLMSVEEFGGSIEAYMYPDEFALLDGSALLKPSAAGDGIPGLYVSQQTRKKFGLCYRTMVGNDLGDEFYKLHFVYGAKVSPSEKQYQTVNDSPEAATLSWEFTTDPVNVNIDGVEYKPTSVITLDTSKFEALETAAKTRLLNNLKTLEAILYGTDADDTTTPPTAATIPRLPYPSEIASIMAANG